MDNKCLIQKMIDILVYNVTDSPYNINILAMMEYVIVFNIFKQNNGLGGLSRKTGLNSKLVSIMGLTPDEIDKIVTLRNILSHIFDNKKDPTVNEIYDGSIDYRCYPYKKDIMSNDVELLIKEAIIILNIALRNL